MSIRYKLKKINIIDIKLTKDKNYNTQILTS